MTKYRIGVVLRESVGGSKADGGFGDLKTLTANYLGFKQGLRNMIVALDKHFMAIKTMTSSRMAVANSFAAMSKATPVWDATGLKPNADHPADTVCSYASVHEILFAKTKDYSIKYKQFILDYAKEWEKIVVTRIDNGIKKTEELRKELNHYQKKVEPLRLTVNQSMARGKEVKSDVQEKLRRNEEKFLNAKQLYNRCATDLCILMEEVCERSWRDLHHLIVKSAQFDSALASDESNILASLNQVVSKLKVVGVANGISPQPRLRDLGTLKPELLSTRPGGVAGLTVENRPVYDGSVFGTGGKVATPTNHQAIAPGATAASGLGGFPVVVGSYDDPLPSMNMISISQSSAPPTTFDDIYSSNNNALSTRSANYGGGELYSKYPATPQMDMPHPPSAPPPPPPLSGGMEGGGGGYNYGMSPSSYQTTSTSTPNALVLYGAMQPQQAAQNDFNLDALYSAGSNSTTTSSSSPIPSWSAGGGSGGGGYGGNTYSKQPIMYSLAAAGGGGNPFDN